MSRKKEILFWSILLIVLVFTVYNIIVVRKSSQTSNDILLENKIGYVDLTRIFSEFEMTKELEIELKEKIIAKENNLNEILEDVKEISKQLQKMNNPEKSLVLKYQNYEQKYLLEKDALDAFKIEETNRYDNMIITQMNQYIADYGEENNYALLLGNVNSGNILYAQPIYDITDAVLNYINDKYQGK